MSTDLEKEVIRLYDSGLSGTKISQSLKKSKKKVLMIIKSLCPKSEFDTIKKFWSKVNKNTDNGCWEWSGCKDRKGYGEFRIFGDNYQAHRIAYMLANGGIPSNISVCHKCDNPKCCNPDHLFAGTNRDNMIDLLLKGKKPDTKLNPQSVKSIREAFKNGVSRAELRQKYNISATCLNSLLRGEKWAYVK